MRLVVLLVVVSILTAGYCGFRFYESFQGLEDTEFTVPGSRMVTLEPGTYRIYMRDSLFGGNQCSPKDDAPELRRMGLRLRPAEGPPLEPVLSGSCDGGSVDQGIRPASISEFRVTEPGTYRFSAERNPPITAYQRRVRAYLVDSTGRLWWLLGGIGAILVAAIGGPALGTVQRRRGTSASARRSLR